MLTLTRTVSLPFLPGCHLGIDASNLSTSFAYPGQSSSPLRTSIWLIMPSVSTTNLTSTVPVQSGDGNLILSWTYFRKLSSVEVQPWYWKEGSSLAINQIWVSCFVSKLSFGKFFSCACANIPVVISRNNEKNNFLFMTSWLS